jgi:hypothetical protein
LNRVAFRLFKKDGGKVRFDKFHADLNTLQHGEFDLRLRLWLKLINETDEKIKESEINIEYTVAASKLTSIVQASLP